MFHRDWDHKIKYIMKHYVNYYQLWNGFVIFSIRLFHAIRAVSFPADIEVEIVYCNILTTTLCTV